MHLQLEVAFHEWPNDFPGQRFQLVCLPLKAFECFTGRCVPIWEGRETDEFLEFVVGKVGLSCLEKGAVEG